MIVGHIRDRGNEGVVRGPIRRQGIISGLQINKRWSSTNVIPPIISKIYIKPGGYNIYCAH